MIRSVVTCGLVALLLAGCATPSTAEPKARAVRQAQAVAQVMSSTPVTFIAASSGPLAQLISSSVNAGPNPDRPVWTVDFKGVFELACGPQQTGAVQTCPVNTTVRVVLDEVTGDVILSETPAPNP